jgi:hypothetical protein
VAFLTVGLSFHLFPGTGGASPRFPPSMNYNDSKPVTAGNYLISPITRLLENGWYACSVSIRSGSGRGSTDRVLRLTRVFRDSLTACEYAIAEGLQWVSAGRTRPALAAAA